VFDGAINGGIIADGIAWVGYYGRLIHMVYETFVIIINLYFLVFGRAIG